MRRRRKKRGFTLIELTVAVTIGVLVIGLGVASINSFLTKQKITQVKTEISSAVKMARNYAVTNQFPTSFSAGMDYVAVTISAAGVLSVVPVNNIAGTGPAYLTKNLAADDVTVSQISFGELLFSASEGKLLGIQSGFNTVPLSAGITRTITVSIEEGGPSTTVSVNSTGAMKEAKEVFVEPTITLTPTPVPLTPTPTMTPIPPTPTVTPASHCICALGKYDTAVDACVGVVCMPPKTCVAGIVLCNGYSCYKKGACY